MRWSSAESKVTINYQHLIVTLIEFFTLIIIE